MKLTVTKTETQEVEINFPLYKKHSGSYYKGISEQEWLQLMPNIKSISVCSSPYQLDRVLTSGEDITEEEFNEKFMEVFNEIESYKPEPSYTPEPMPF